MAIEERYKYLGLMQEWYWAGGTAEQGHRPDVMEKCTELQWDSLIRLSVAGCNERSAGGSRREQTERASQQMAREQRKNGPNVR